MDHFRYPRHFLLLACCGLLLCLITALHLSTNVTASFALYGALHASALVLALRARQGPWRTCLFIAMAAVLSAMTLRAGIFAGQLSGALPGNATLYAVLGFSAATGAVTYGLLIRALGIYAFTSTEFAGISIGCILAACASFFILSHFHSLGRWWLAVAWWCAFSGGLWYFDRRRHSTHRQ
jgi:Flp pilus assembly protein TadB